jgi:hypothetical protein
MQRINNCGMLASSMGFIERFFKNTDVKVEDVLSFVSQKIEENMNLEYKNIEAYHDPDKLAIGVASFANTDGGLMILGVAESKIKDEKGRTRRIYPEKITWGEVSLDKEKLENQLAIRIQPSISGLVVRPIRNEKDQVIFLIEIPKSDSAPHMSNHKYHKRLNFGVRPMEHYEVANLFRANWTMKQKLVEGMYEPLCSILENHGKQLGQYDCPDGRDFEAIMSKTYYKAQMPVELLEGIDYFVEQLGDLNREEYFVRESVLETARKNIADYLSEKYGIRGGESVVLEYVSVNTKPRKLEVKLDPHLIYKLLITNQNVGSYVSKAHWRNVYEEVTILYLAETYQIDLRDFDGLIWSKCLKEVSQNPRITQFKKDAQVLSQEAWDLIEEILKY